MGLPGPSNGPCRTRGLQPESCIVAPPPLLGVSHTEFGLGAGVGSGSLDGVGATLPNHSFGELVVWDSELS